MLRGLGFGGALAVVLAAACGGGGAGAGLFQDDGQDGGSRSSEGGSSRPSPSAGRGGSVASGGRAGAPQQQGGGSLSAGGAGASGRAGAPSGGSAPTGGSAVAGNAGGPVAGAGEGGGGGADHVDGGEGGAVGGTGGSTTGGASGAAGIGGTSGGTGGTKGEPCTCSTGACCDGCHPRPATYECGQAAKYRQRCNQDGNVDAEYWTTLCDGTSSTECTRWGRRLGLRPEECPDDAQCLLTPTPGNPTAACTPCTCATGECCDGCHPRPSSYLCREIERPYCKQSDWLVVGKFNLFCDGSRSDKCTRAVRIADTSIDETCSGSCVDDGVSAACVP